MISSRFISSLFLLLFLVVSAILYYPQWQERQQKETQLAAALSSTATTTLDVRTKTEGCQLNGALPDHACTPGAVFDSISIPEMCTPGYTKTVRDVPTTLRKAVFAEYGVPYPVPRGSYEVDHLIPLAIGGDNDIANLFPQPADPRPGFKEKDIVEVFLEEQVCDGKVALPVAQKQIATDWLIIYNNLSPGDITRIKSKYTNWSN